MLVTNPVDKNVVVIIDHKHGALEPVNKCFWLVLLGGIQRKVHIIIMYIVQFFIFSD